MKVVISIFLLLFSYSAHAEKFGSNLGVQRESEILKQSAEEIQTSLIWLGYYNGMVDGEIGRRSLNAIKEFQKTHGYPQTGSLDNDSYRKLVELASQVRVKHGWARFEHPQLRYTISYPSIDLPLTEILDLGGRRFYSNQNKVEMRVDVSLDQSRSDFIDLYGVLSQSTASRSINYHRKSRNWFVIIGSSNDLSFYTRVNFASNGLIGYTFIWPSEKSIDYERISIAIANSFYPPAKVFEITEASKQDIPQYVKNIEQSVPGNTAEKKEPVPLIGGANALEPTALSPSDIFQKVNGAVWTLIAAEVVDDEIIEGSVFTGSAVAISTSLLVTNCHTIEKSNTTLIVRKDAGQEDGERVFGVKIFNAQKDKDMCIMELIDGELEEYVKLRKSNSIKIGERVYTIGSPSQLDLTLGEGLISGVREFSGTTHLQSSAPIAPGSSGGGLFDSFGRLIGVTTFQHKSSQSLNFAIAIDEFPLPEQMY
tara:strand:+ start:4507 stop:5949 length:1443 start_codon:yes stop_codon:yes gene_type:complete